VAEGPVMTEVALVEVRVVVEPEVAAASAAVPTAAAVKPVVDVTVEAPAVEARTAAASKAAAATQVVDMRAAAATAEAMMVKAVEPLAGLAVRAA